jgi:flagellar motor protein MotB
VAKKGGGAWKVAYADFVTAMMAFFLVMWLCAQDQKVKQAVAEYFIDPTGASKKPGQTGSLFQSPTTGSVPKAESVSMGRGRKSYTSQGENGLATRLVGEWIQSDEKLVEQWRQKAALARQLAPWSKEVREGRTSAKQAAIQQLANQLKDEITRGMPPQLTGLYQDLLGGAVADVNWTELAEDLFGDEVLRTASGPSRQKGR